MVSKVKLRPLASIPRLAAALLIGIAATAIAQAPTGTRIETHPAPALVPADDLLFASPTRLDHVGRVVAPVMVDGQGPFRFIVDTGATRSTISPQLAAKLGLDPGKGTPLEVNGITGSAAVPSVSIISLRAGALVLTDSQFPVVWAPLMAGADGILGIAGLRDKRLFVDFRHNSVAITVSGGATAPPGFDRVSGQLLESGLLMISARVGGVRTEAIIDTGSERSIGNTALRDALAWRRRKGHEPEVTEVYGATPTVGSGVIDTVPTIDFGRLHIEKVTLVYGPFHIFKVWGLESRPALIIGMDVLGTVNALAIDFKRAELDIDTRYHTG